MDKKENFKKQQIEYACNPNEYQRRIGMQFIGELSKEKGNIPQLYNDKSECCGCTACFAVCPLSGENCEHSKDVAIIYSISNHETKNIKTTGALTMLPDEEGFLYPVVDADTCVRCYKCMDVCPIREVEKSDDK